MVDVDSKINILAFAKISALHKVKGDNVTLIRGSQVKFTDTPDQIYISVIYKKNKLLADKIIAQYPEVYIDAGGSSYDLNK